VLQQKPPKSNGARKNFNAHGGTATILADKNTKARRLDPFTRSQKDKLLQLRDAMVDSMAGVAKDKLRSRADGSEASAFGIHQADAGSDAYDRAFALSLLSQEQDALYEIDQALKRIELGKYGTCEMSGKSISRARLEAIPFVRFTVECQSQLEKQNKASRVRQSATSLFGLTDEGGAEALQDDLRELSQGDLSDLTRKCIKSAEWIAEKFINEPEFEWSCAVLPLCKGLENELHERILLPLRESSRLADLSADCIDNDMRKIARYCAGKAKKPPEIGVFAWFLQTVIHSKSRAKTSALLALFIGLVAKMANKKWLLASDGLLAALNSATDRFRNPAAHLASMSRHDYLECREFLIGLSGVLWTLINATSLAKEVR
jgi:RNA polymerase-binding transcription factor DksA